MKPGKTGKSGKTRKTGTMREFRPLTAFGASVVVFALGTLASSPALAFEYCVRAQMDISNSLPPPAQDWPGSGVNYWRMDGVRMKAQKLSNGNWIDVTPWQYSDEDACVHVAMSNGQGYYRARVQTRGEPAGDWHIVVTDTDDPADILYFTDATNGHYISDLVSAQTFDITYQSDLLRIYTILANVARERFNGGLSGTTVHVQLVDTDRNLEPDTVCATSGAVNASRTCDNGTKVQIQVGSHARSKQLIAHEWGHVVHER